MHFFRIIDLYRKTSISKNFNYFKHAIYLKNEELKNIQTNALVIFLISLKKNHYFEKYLKKYSDKDIANNSHHILSELPLTDKQIINSNYDKIFNSKYKNYEIKHTGGSTGNAFKYAIDKQSISNSLAFGFSLWNHFLNYQLGDKVIVIAGKSLGSNVNIKKKFYNFLQNRTYIAGDIIALSEAKKIETIIHKSKNGLFIYGYPSSILSYTELIKKENINTERIKGVITTSETLFDNDKRKIEQFFNTRVLNIYGANDGGISSGSIDNINFLYNGLNCYVENIQIEGLNEIVLTNLNSRVFPFVRYRVGDCAEVITDYNAYPFILKNLNGRTRDFLFATNKGKTHGVIINKIFEKYNVDCQYQIEQFENLNCKLYLKFHNNTIDKDTFIQKIIYDIKLYLGNIDIEVLETDTFIKTQNSKHKLIISHVKQ